jgi:hypothetical protein
MHLSYLKHIKENGTKNTSIDRIDNNGNYCKENCKRSTNKEQRNNQNIYRTINGKKIPLFIKDKYGSNKDK